MLRLALHRRNLRMIMAAIVLASMLGAVPLYAERILVPIGKSTILRTPSPVKRIFVVRQGIIEAPVVTDREIILTGIGQTPDSTQIILWDQTGAKTIRDVATYLEDDLLREKAAALLGEPGITLQIFPNIVYLTGVVDAPEKKTRAETIMAGLVRDRKFESLLEVRPVVTLQQRIVDALRIPTVKVTVVAPSDPHPPAPADAAAAGGDGTGTAAPQDVTVVLEGTVEDQNEYIRMSEIAAGFVTSERFLRNLVTIRNPIQVIFQAYVLEMRRETSQDLGIRWGSADTLGGGLKQGIVHFFENVSSDFRGTAQVGPAPVPDRVNPFAMNNMNRFEIIAAQINALERAGKVRVLANPKLICYANTRPTKIAGTGWLGEGMTEPGAQPAAAQPPDQDSGIAFFQTGTQREVLVGRDATGAPITRQYNAHLRLTIRDLFIKEDDLKFSVFAKRDDFDETANAVNTRSLSTTIKSRNGDTIVLGGLITRNNLVTREGVPGLSRIPYIGRLFRWTRDRIENTELVILLTPQIVGRSPLPARRYKTVPVPRRSDRLEKLHTLFQKIQARRSPEEAGR